MAPKARILYYASASCYDADFLDTLGRVVDDNLATLVSNSWSDYEENETSENVAAYESGVPAGRDPGHRLRVLLR